MKFADITKETVSSTGTTDFITSGAVSGFIPFATSYAVGDQVPYHAKQGATAFEIGTGTKTSTGIARTTVHRSSNANALVNFAAGVEVFATQSSTHIAKFEQGTSLRTVYASNFAVSDADLALGSTTFGSDQTAKLQAMLDLASAGPLLVIWDIACGVTSVSGTEALRVRSNTTIRALAGCGAIMRTEQLTPMFRNYNPNVNPNTFTDKNIVIEGGIWHGNRGNQSTSSTTANGGIFLFDFIGVDGLRMVKGIEWRNSKSFAFRAANCYNVLLDDFEVDFGAGNTALNTDGVHFNGPCRFVTISNGRLFNCADDAISITADDGWGAGGQYGPYGHVYGEISDVNIADIFLQGSVCGLRLLSGGSRMDRFKISNIQGKTGGYWLIIDNFLPGQTELTGPGNIGSVEIDGVCMENVPVGGGWPKIQAHVNCKVEQLSFRNVTKGKFNNELYPILQLSEKADVGQLRISNIKSFPFNGGTYLTDQIKLISGARVGTMVIDGCIFDAPNTSGSPVVIDAGATVNTLTLMNNTGHGFSNFLGNSGTVSILNYPAASNFMATPAQLPAWVPQASTPWVTDISTPGTLYYDGPKAGTVASIKNAASDAFGGNVQLAARLNITGTVGLALHAALFVRGVGSVPWSSSQYGYYVDIDVNSTGSGGIKLAKRSAGSDVDLGTRSGSVLALGTNYDIKLIVKTVSSTTTLSVYIQRVSDSLYLQSDGTWSAAANPMRSQVDASPPAQAAGEYGFYGYCENDGNISLTNIVISAAP